MNTRSVGGADVSAISLVHAGGKHTACRRPEETGLRGAGSQNVLQNILEKVAFTKGQPLWTRVLYMCKRGGDILCR
jgi:hypothetical protein